MSKATERACMHNRERLLAKANVVGIGDAGDHVLVLVERKLPLSALSAEDVVDPIIDGVPTKVLEVGKVRPMVGPGTSIGTAGHTGTGTFGAVVRDEHGNRYGITNNHVAADSNRALATVTVLSPGPADGNGSRIGALARFEPIWFDRPNLMDAALVRLDDHVRVGPPRLPDRAITPRVGWRVQKYGRTTGRNDGTVLARTVTIDVYYGSSLGTARFDGQVLTTPMLWPGDSGSVLLTSGGYPCALGFAGSDTVSVHNPLHLVLRTLAVQMA